MDGYELMVVVVFFLVGYWVVDYFWPKKKPPDLPNVPNVPNVPTVPEKREP